MTQNDAEIQAAVRLAEQRLAAVAEAQLAVAARAAEAKLAAEAGDRS